MRKLAPSCKLGNRISLPTASPAGFVTGSSGLKAGMEFKNQSAWKLRLLTKVGEITRVHVATGELNRLNEDCRLAAVPRGCRKLPLAMSLDRFSAYRTKKLSLA